MDYNICTFCVMDTSDPKISFDAEGRCNHCRSYSQLVHKVLIADSHQKKDKLNSILNQIKEAGGGQPYDCLAGVSGGDGREGHLQTSNALVGCPYPLHLEVTPLNQKCRDGHL